jgi:hypothetical protein
MFKKGDRVEWSSRTTGNKPVFGTVLKGGKKQITVIHDGGKYQTKGPADHFHYSDKPLPNADEKNVMKRYSVKSYREIEGHGDSATFSCKICLDGKPVLAASNSGWGGPNEYHTYRIIDENNRHIEAQAEKLAQEWIKDATGCDKKFEALDLWIGWEVFERPFGITAKESLKWLEEMRQEA